VYLLEKESQQYTVLSAGEWWERFQLLTASILHARRCCRNSARLVYSYRHGLVVAQQLAPVAAICWHSCHRMRNDNKAIINSTIREKLFEQQPILTH